MDTFEREQTVEAIKTIVKARWFYVAIIVAQGVIIKLWFPLVPLPNNALISLVATGILLFNFRCWLYLRRPPEKMADRDLKIIKFSQVAVEQIGLTTFLYFSGTANKLFLMLYVIPIMVGTGLYKAKGIVFSTLSAAVLYTGLVFLEYFGLMWPLPLEAASQAPGKFLTGESVLARIQIVAFNLYILAASIYAGYIAGLFRKREKRIVMQKNELADKTQILAGQTQELAQAKDWLKEALTKSDIARLEATGAKLEQEKANTELKEKIGELERFYKISVGRELKMIELKKQIKNLQEAVKKPGNSSAKK